VIQKVAKPQWSSAFWSCDHLREDEPPGGSEGDSQGCLRESRGLHAGGRDCACTRGATRKRGGDAGTTAWVRGTFVFVALHRNRSRVCSSPSRQAVRFDRQGNRAEPSKGLCSNSGLIIER